MSASQHVVIRASAGSGKTFQLSSRFLQLLLDGTPENEILATTFTRKAAAEILSRVLTRLANACRTEATAAELADQLGGGELTTERCRITLRRLVHNLHRVRVGTLDSFFAALAGSYSLELGLPPGWDILDDQIDRQLRDEAIGALLHEGQTSDLRRLVHLMTKGEADRSVAKLIREQVGNLYTLYQDAAEAAWRSLPRPNPLSQDQLQDAIDSLTNCPLPKDKRWDKAVGKDLTTIAGEDWQSLLTAGIAAKVINGEDKYCGKPIPDDVRDVYNKLIQHGRAILLRTLADQTEATYELLHRFAAQYEPRKLQRQGMLFDDVTRRLAAYLESTDEEAEVDRMTYRLDARVTHLLLDEFQDTSAAQWRVLKPFARRITCQPTSSVAADDDSDDAPAPSFLCVGDVKQAIYGWRGGIAEIFDTIEKELDGLDRQFLNESRRSHPAVIRTVNRIFDGVRQHPNLDHLAEPIANWQKRFQQHDTVKKVPAGYAELSTCPRAEEGESQKDVNLRHAADVVADLARKAPDRSIGVLVRQNKVVAQLIYEIRRRGVDASEEGGNPLTDSAAVRALVSLLRIADHPGDTAARMHLAATPLGPLVDWPADQGDLAAAHLAKSIRLAIQTDGYGAAVERWVQLLLPRCTARDQCRLMQLVEMAYGYPADRRLRTGQFVWFVENTQIRDPTTANVRVMTIHQAKGLEFDVVLLPELDTKLGGQPANFVTHRSSPTAPIDRVCMYRNAAIQTLLPRDVQQMFRDATQQAINETLCNLYVSVTRPILALYMLVSPAAQNERNLGKTYAGLLRAALTDGHPAPADTVLYHDGDASWYADLTPAVPAAPPATAAPATPRAIRLAPMPTRKRSVPRVSPSRLSHGAAVDAGSLFQQRDQSALKRGTVLHACFERVLWLNESPPTTDALREVLRAMDTAGLDRNELIAEFHDMLQRGDTPNVLRRSFYELGREAGDGRFLPENGSAGDLRLDIYTERAFAVHDDDSILNGSIDRLVLVYQRDRIVAADVIDFKTDRVDTANAAEVAATVASYRPQLEAYRSAVHKIYGLPKDRIAARLLLVGDGLLCDV